MSDKPDYEQTMDLPEATKAALASAAKQDLIKGVLDLIKAKTDNIPSDPAKESGVLAVAAKQGTAIIPSDVVRLSSDSLVTGNQITYTKVKEVRVSTAGDWRVKFDLRSNGGTVSYGRIYKNGAAYGTERSQSGTTWDTKIEDLWFNQGDLVQLYAYNATGGGNKYEVQNYRLCGNFDLAYGVVIT